MFDLVENRLFAYADDSTLLSVIRRPSDKPTVAASVNRYLVGIHEWCGRWCMLLNPKKSKALVVSRSRTVYHPHGHLGLSGVPILSNPSLDILGVRFDCKITFESHVRGVVSRVSQRIGILRMVNGVYADTSVLLRCYHALILPILEYCSPVWGLLPAFTFGFLTVRFVQSLGQGFLTFSPPFPPKCSIPQPFPPCFFYTIC